MGLLLAIAVLISFYLTPVAMRLAWGYGAVSRPDGYRKKHARPTPEWGGLAVNASILAGLGLSLFLIPMSSEQASFIGALAASVAMLCLLGCFDDLFDLRAGLKLVGQLIAIVPVIAVGAYAERLCLFGYTVELGWFGIPWTMAWIVLGINALNLIDGMDGLASTIGITIAAAVAIIAAVAGNSHVAVVAVVLAGALAGFLAHNLPPARIYLGDCGSMVIGLVLSTSALHATDHTSAPNLMVMAALLFIPLYDTALAIVRRGLSGKGIMAADRGHIHHRLLDRGLGVWASLAVLGCLSFATCCAGYFAVISGQEVIAGTAIVAAAIICLQLDLFGRHEWNMLKGHLKVPQWRGKAGEFTSRTNQEAAHNVAMCGVSEMPSQREQLEGRTRGRSSIPMGINVRITGAQNASAASAGKKYVELLG